MKRYIIFLILLSNYSIGFTQTFSHEPSFIANDMIWNPASTAERDYLEYGAFYRQQWVGFDGAPKTLMAHVEYPFLYNDFSIGGYIYSDRSGVMDYFKAGANYAYKMKIGLKRFDQLSIGLSANISKFSLNAGRAAARDTGDPNILNFNGSALKPDFDIGVFYLSDSRVTRERSYYFVGLSANSVVNGVDLFRQENPQPGIDRDLHANAMLGINQYLNTGSILAYTWLSYTNNHSYRVGASADYVYSDALSFGLLGASDGSVGIKLGTSIYSGFMGDGRVKLAVAGYSNMSVNSLGSNPTMEVYVSYEFRTE